MNIKNVPIWILAASLGAGIADARKMKGDDLSNMIIEGESRLQVHQQVPKLDWSTDLYKNMNELMRDHSIVGEFKPPEFTHPPLMVPERSQSTKTASPWLSSIYEAPILTLNVKPVEKEQKQEWMFLVKDSKGKVFYQERKKGAPPRQITWDGFGDDGEALHVGYDYTYTLSMIDEGGNPQRFPGKAFRLGAFRYKGLAKTCTSVVPEKIFDGSSSLSLSQEGIDMLNEIKDSLRKSYGSKVEIATFHEDLKFAESRSGTIKKFLAKGLDLPDEWLTTSANPPAKGGGYHHVDIIVR